MDDFSKLDEQKGNKKSSFASFSKQNDAYEKNKAQKLSFVSGGGDQFSAFGGAFGMNNGNLGMLDKSLDKGNKKAQKSSLLHQLDELEANARGQGAGNKMGYGGGGGAGGLGSMGGNNMLLGGGMGLGGQKMQGGYQLQADERDIVKNKDEIMKNLGRAAIRRMARRGGCKRVAYKIHDESRDAMFTFLEKVLADTVTYVHHSKRQTVKPRDVVNALKRQGRAIYGFGN
eukprot:g6086.t1